MALTTDVIARCAFGTKINAFDNSDNRFVKCLSQFALDGVDMGPELTLICKIKASYS
jgi:hypothetical protein